MVSKKFIIVIVGVAIVLVLSWVGITILRSDHAFSTSFNQNLCKAQIERVSACLKESGEWNSELKNLKADDYGVSLECLKTNGPLEGTPWKADETHFNCGPKPS
ncbi:MAG: hypothetical protein AABY04_04415 [Candidatus Micrarchaeota archaeon]